MSYALVKIDTGEEFRFFSGDKMPDPVVWPNGDASHACPVGEERAGYRFVKVEYDPGPPNEFYAVADATPSVVGDTMVVNRIWAPIDAVEAKAIVSERLKKAADQAVCSLVSQADIARALASGGTPPWSAAVAAIDADLQKSLATLAKAATVDEAAAVAVVAADAKP